MEAIGLVLAIVGGVLSFLTCRPDFSPEGVAGATACSVVQAAVADATIEPVAQPARTDAGPTSSTFTPQTSDADLMHTN